MGGWRKVMGDWGVVGGRKSVAGGDWGWLEAYNRLGWLGVVSGR